MNAIEDLAGLDDAPGVAARDLHERIASGPVDAGEPQDGDGGAGSLRRTSARRRSAASRSRPRADVRLRRRFFVDPGAATVAVNADRSTNRRSIAAGAHAPTLRQKPPAPDRRFRSAESKPAPDRLRRWRVPLPASAKCRRRRTTLQPAAETRVQEQRRVRRRAPCRRCARSRRRTCRRNVPPNSRARSRAAWTLELHPSRAAAHSATTSGSDSAARKRLAQRLRAARGRAGRAPTRRRRERAARDRPSNRSASSARPRSPELPIAISTLRRKRARPMRLTALLLNRARKRGVVEPRRARQAAARATRHALQASFRARPGRICSTDKPRGNRRSHRCDCRSAGAASRGIGPLCSMVR